MHLIGGSRIQLQLAERTLQTLWNETWRSFFRTHEVEMSPLIRWIQETSGVLASE